MHKLKRRLTRPKASFPPNPVVVFSKTYCGYCQRVKQLLTQLGATYKLLELDEESKCSWRRKDSGITVGRIVCCSAQPPHPAWPGRAVPEQVQKTWDGPKPISIVGSTGSIGTQTLDIVAENPDKFRVVALAAGTNVTLLADQVKRFKPQLVSVRDESLVGELKEALADIEQKPEIIPGEQGIIEVARHPDAVTVVTGIVGCAGLKPTVAAIEAGKHIALANKETLIAGGPFVLPLAHKHNIKILPADSEHSAIFQCIQGLPEGALWCVILTGSSGTFRTWPAEKLKDVKIPLFLDNWDGLICVYQSFTHCLGQIEFTALK
ncbi:hypothetical protein Q3G72_026748 [Acer saccharum]|nr:hypothetical protein Q3G72_026748 [Acer saccharum]